MMSDDWLTWVFPYIRHSSVLINAVFKLSAYRYGSPSSATKDYQEFAQWFLPTFSGFALYF